MKTLDELLSDLARRGELTHLSVAKTGAGFTAAFAPASVMGTSHATDADPLKAIRAAVEGVSMKRRASVSKPTDPHESDENDFG